MKVVEYLKLVGKFVAYYDKDLKRRCGKVTRVNGKQSVTLRDAYGHKHRVKRAKIIGQETPKSGIISICWGLVA